MLEGKIAIITGGTRGIGFEIAHTFLENKAKVCILGSRAETVESAIKSLKSLNSSYEVIGLYPDLTDKESIEEVFLSIQKQYGRIDILVNNAGISSKTSLSDYAEIEVEKILDINIKAVFWFSKYASKYIKMGSIINISSVTAQHGQARGCLYPASKAAVEALTKSLALELASSNIRVNAIAPGVIETDMVTELNNDLKDRLKEKMPLNRFGTPNDIANVALFLASDISSYITGAIIPVDGCYKG